LDYIIWESPFIICEPIFQKKIYGLFQTLFRIFKCLNLTVRSGYLRTYGPAAPLGKERIRMLGLDGRQELDASDHLKRES
jgi:hypothetical protein